MNTPIRLDFGNCLRLAMEILLASVLCLLMVGVGIAQVGGTVTGKIIDEGTGEPLPGANVLVVGTKLGAASGPDGSFAIKNIPSGTYRLQSSFIGYKSQGKDVKVSANEEVTVDFSLKLDPLNAEEIVVTGVASKTSKAVAPIAVQRISARELTEVSEYTTVHELLAGKVAGVSLQRSQGAFGAGTRFIVRSGGGINGDGQPVIYVDGVKVENTAWTTGRGEGQGISSLLSLDPDDIENVEVIKGPAGASSYGTGGSNGVVLITTKRGRLASGGRDWSVTYKGTFGYHDLPKLGEEVFRNYQYMNNWFERGAIARNSVNISGGTENMRMFLSVDRNVEDGHTPKNAFNQTHLRVNLDYVPVEKFSLRLGTQFDDSEVEFPQRGRGDGEFGYLVFARFPYDPRFGTIQPSFWDSQNDRNFINGFTGSLTAEYSPFLDSNGPLRGLSGRFTFGIDDRDNRSIYSQDVTTIEVEGEDQEGLRRIAQRNGKIYSYTGDVAYQYALGNLSATSTAGAQLFNERSRVVVTEKEQFPTSLITDIAGGSRAGQIYEENNHFRSAGIFTEHNFSLNDTYFATFMVRQDYASVLGALTSSITYPAAKFAVRLDRFGWTPSFFSFLKLRTAYGETGVLPGRLDGISLLWRARESQYGVGANISAIGNPALKPERVKEWEMGFEAEVANFALDFTYYRQNTTDSIVPRENVPSSGLTESDPRFNIGKIEGSGWEAQLHANFAGRSLGGWRANFTLTTAFQKNKVTDMGGANEIRQGPGGGRQVYKEGLPKGAFFNPVALGALFSDGTNVQNLELWPSFGEVVAAGVPYDLLISDGPVYLGKSDPDYIGSFSTNLSLGGFTLYGLLEWKTGFYVYNEQRVDMIFSGAFDNPDWANGDGSNVLDWDVLSQELGLGDTNTGVTELTPGSQEYIDAANQWASTSPFFDANSIQPGDFLKLREVSLSYNFDRLIRSSAIFGYIQGLRIGIVATNLKNWFKRSPSKQSITLPDGTKVERWIGGFTGIDSEINSLGFDDGPQSAMQSGTIPPSRTISGFVTLTF